MECLTSLLKPGPPQAQPQNVSPFVSLWSNSCHLLGASCHFQSKRISTLTSQPLLLPLQSVSYIAARVTLYPKSDLITHLLKTVVWLHILGIQFNFLHHAYWHPTGFGPWTSPIINSHFPSIMPRHRPVSVPRTCQFSFYPQVMFTRA